MDLFDPRIPGNELQGGLAVFGAGLIGLLLLRFLWDFVRSPRGALRNAFSMDAEGWRLIGILLFLGIAMMCVWWQVL